MSATVIQRKGTSKKGCQENVDRREILSGGGWSPTYASKRALSNPPLSTQHFSSRQPRNEILDILTINNLTNIRDNM